MHAVLPEDTEPSVEVDALEDTPDFLSIELLPLTLSPAEQALVVLAQQGLGGVQFGESVVEPLEDGRLQLGEGVGVLVGGQQPGRIGVGGRAEDIEADPDDG